MTAKIPSVDTGALGRRPDVSAPRGIVSYHPVVAPSGAEGLISAGKELTDFGIKALGEEVKDQQDSALKKAQVDWSAKKMSILYGDGQASPGYTTTQGQDAIDKFTSTKDQLAKARDEVLGGLQGDVARRFDAWSMVDQQNAFGTMQGHFNQQNRVVRDQHSTAFIGQMQQEIVANPNDVNGIKMRRLEIMRETLALADSKGIKDENARQDLVRKAWTEAHKEAINRLLVADDTVGAKAYLERFRGDIDPMQIGAIEKAVQAGTITKEAQDAADYAVTKFQNVDDALVWVRKKYAGKEEKAAVAEVKSRYLEGEQALARQDRAKAREDRAALEQGQAAADQIVQPGVTETQALTAAQDYKGKVRQQAEISIRAHFASVDRQRREDERALRASASKKALNNEDFSPAENEAVDGILGLRQRLDAIRQNAAAGLPQISDEKTREDLLKLYRDNKVAFSQVDLYGEQYGGKLNRSDLTRMENLQIGLDKEAVRRDAKVQSEAAKAARLSRAMTVARPYLRGAGYTVGGKGDNTGPFLTALVEKMDQLPHDKPVTDKELQELTLGLLIRGENPEESQFLGMGDKNVRGFQAMPKFYTKDFATENKDAIDALSRRSGVDPVRTAVILEAMLRKGIPTTAENIAALDRQLKAKGK